MLGETWTAHRMLAKLEEQEGEEEAAKEKALEKKRDAEQRRLERAEWEIQKKQIKEQRLELEVPSHTPAAEPWLLKSCSKTRSVPRSLTQRLLVESAELLRLETDLSSLARKELDAAAHGEAALGSGCGMEKSPSQAALGPVMRRR